MIVVDANLLIYAYGRSVHQSRAKQWIEEIFSGFEPVGIPWQSIAAFLRVLTRPDFAGGSIPMSAAAGIVDTWLAQPNVRLLAPGDEHWAHLRQLMIEGQVRGPMVTDAQIAALSVEYGGTVYTADTDFARFPGLRWTNPLA